MKTVFVVDKENLTLANCNGLFSYLILLKTVNALESHLIC